ncbi:hypothetical protein [Bizionia arctica]|uniref:Lipoprotein n=1 Tax=Bizionia arctica TaxID=1495645 RepID=A0A917GXM8_9FLAO|nr:hypothetical protein [Bizionia arctica]GGG60783.1 hypothetical protein GCM10010976_34370 [Bizionia arctica]
MKYWILTLTMLIFGCKNNQEKQPTLELADPILIECDSMYEKAEADYKNGIKEYTIMGLVYATELEMYYSDFMKRNYNITMRVNCVPNYPQSCYEESMNYEIEEEYGEDFMKLTREKAEMEFNEQRK